LVKRLGLKRISISPVVKIGKASMWYCRGIKVFEPCQYNSIAVVKRMTPAIVGRSLSIFEVSCLSMETLTLSIFLLR
jgi:hypothetical protein